jgi:DNA-binding MarR family transcriptional regulator
LSTLLSQVLVAFTIEFDNEFERQMPHRTTIGGAGKGPWLVSMVMWSNFLQYVGEEGVTVGELQRLARVPKLSLSGMERWGYVTVEPKKLRSQWVIRATAKGQMAQQVWRPLSGVIEKRWEQRFGEEEISKLRKSLSALASQMDVELPDYLPVLGFGFCTEILCQKLATPAVVESGLPALLSKVLLAFTLDFEREFGLSLPMCANILRVLNEAGVRARDLPRLAGVSKEAIKMALGFLAKRHLIASGQLVSLTPKGRLAQEAYRKRLSATEELWRARFGNDVVKLRESLEPLLGERLFLGLTPHEEGWRASAPKPDTLPHYPMVLHRGGYPDGS